MTSSLKTFVAVTASFTVTSACLLAAGDGWMTDFDEAKKEAEAGKKDLLMDFTGSDWCGWCIRLKEEVFSKEAFKKAAPDHFVMLELDFPKSVEQSESLKTQNSLLRDFYEIQGYPSIVLTDAEGRAYAKTGYQKGGAEAYLSHLEELRQIRVKRDEAFAKAESATGLEKAKLLQVVLKAIGDDDLIRKHYGTVADEIIELDAEDQLGYKENRDFQDKLDGLDEEIQKSLKAGGLDTVPALIDEFVTANKLIGEQKQRVLLGKIGMHFQMQQHEQSLKVAKRVVAIDPETESGKSAAALVVQIEKFMKENAIDSE